MPPDICTCHLLRHAQDGSSNSSATDIAGDIVEWSSAPTAAQQAQPAAQVAMHSRGNTQLFADGQSALHGGTGMLPLLTSDEGRPGQSASQVAVQVPMTLNPQQ